MLSEYTAKNNEALQKLVTEHKVKLKRFPDDVLKKLKELSDQVVAELAKKDAFSQKVFDSYKKYRDNVVAWHNISERDYINARS